MTWSPNTTGKIAFGDARLSFKDVACTMPASIGDTVLACKGIDGTVWLVEGTGSAILTVDQTGDDVGLLLTGQYLTCSSLSYDANDLFVLVVGQARITGQTAFIASCGSASAASLISHLAVLFDNTGDGNLSCGDTQVSLSRDKVCYTYLASGSIYMGRNGGIFSTAVNGIGTSSPQTVLTIGCSPTIDDPWSCVLSRWGAWTNSTSSSHLGTNISTALSASSLPLSSNANSGTSFVLIEGDSQAQAIGAANTSDDWITAFLSSLGAFGIDVSNVIVEDLGTASSVVGTSSDGLTVNSCYARISFVITELNAAIAAGCSSALLLLQIGENDLSNGLTASQFLTNLEAYVAAVRAGLSNPSDIPFHVVWGSVPPRTDNTGATYEGARATVNASSSISGIDAIAPIGSNATIGPVSAVSNSALYADGIHWATGGAAVAGPLYATAALPFVVAASGPRPFAWYVLEDDGGVIDSSGNYTAPETAGTYHIVAVSNADPTQVGVSTVVVS